MIKVLSLKLISINSIKYFTCWVSLIKKEFVSAREMEC